MAGVLTFFEHKVPQLDQKMGYFYRDTNSTPVITFLKGILENSIQ